VREIKAFLIEFPVTVGKNNRDERVRFRRKTSITDEGFQRKD